MKMYCINEQCPEKSKCLRFDEKGHIRIVNMNDIDITNPVESLERYAGFDWTEWCKLKIKKWIEDNK